MNSEASRCLLTFALSADTINDAALKEANIFSAFLNNPSYIFSDENGYYIVGISEKYVILLIYLKGIEDSALYMIMENQFGLSESGYSLQKNWVETISNNNYFENDTSFIMEIGLSLK